MKNLPKYLKSWTKQLQKCKVKVFLNCLIIEKKLTSLGETIVPLPSESNGLTGPAAAAAAFEGTLASGVDTAAL